MKIKDKYLAWDSGYIRFKNGLEINWGLNEWALPLSIDINEYFVFIRVFCIMFIIKRK